MAGLDKLALLRLIEPVEASYNAALDRVVVTLAKRIGEWYRSDGANTAAAFANFARVAEETDKLIDDATKDVPGKIETAINGAADNALAEVNDEIKRARAEGKLPEQDEKSGAVDAAVGAIILQANEKATGVNATMKSAAQTAYAAAVQEVDYWQMQPVQGGGEKDEEEEKQGALRKAISSLADGDIIGFIDRDGRGWLPTAYMSMVLFSLARQTGVDAVQARAEEVNANVFQVSAHPGARPLCYPYQGMLLSWDNTTGVFTDGAGVQHRYTPLSATSYGEPAGLFGINCGHYPIPMLPGASVPRQFEIQSKEENDAEYQATQKLRAYERSVRDGRRKEAAYRAAGDTAAADRAAKTVKRRETRVAEYARANGLERRPEREALDYVAERKSKQK